MSDHETPPSHNSQHGEEPSHHSREILLKQVGQRLHDARRNRDISLEDAVHALKLRRVYVEALEDGDWESLPGEVYAIGFLRQYASFLNMDMDGDIKKLKSEEYELTRPETFPDPPIAPKKSWVIVALLVLLVLFIAFNIFSDSDKPESVQQEVEAPIAMPSGDMPLPPEDGADDANSLDTSSLPPETTPTDVEPPSTAPEPIKQHTYRFEAVGEDVWLQLSTAGEEPQLLREVLLHAGESVSITEAETTLLLTCGNPPALAVYGDGKQLIAAGQLGEPSRVIRDYRLTLADE